MAGKTPIAIAVVEHAGRLLVGTRQAGTSMAGKAEFPGGKVEPGETTSAAAVRECWEETGLRVEVTRLRQQIRYHYSDDQDRDSDTALQLFFFDCRPLDPQAEPKPPFHWCPARDLAQLDFPAGNAEVLTALLREFD